eukprot:11943845-Heterocapsa_arctica.AAC.1
MVREVSLDIDLINLEAMDLQDMLRDDADDGYADDDAEDDDDDDDYDAMTVKMLRRLAKGK